MQSSTWWLAPTTANAGTFQLHLSTGANRQCVLQVSTNLTGWTSIYTNITLTNGTFDFTNTIASPRQFTARSPRRDSGRNCARLDVHKTRGLSRRAGLPRLSRLQ